MSAYREALTGVLAHGHRQWIELAVVIAADPDLILLDEPAAGMTDAETARTAELILEINRQHAVVVVEHDMSFIRRIARTVTVLHQGSILMEDTPDRIFTDSLI